MFRTLIFIAGVALVGLAAYWFLAGSDRSQVCSLEISETAPSGRTVELCDVVYEVQPNDDVWAIIRVLDPGLVTNAGRDDHDWACALWGIDALEKEPRPTRVVVQIMTRPFVRGEAAPGITQSIEAYSVPGDACVWELL